MDSNSEIIFIPIVVSLLKYLVVSDHFTLGLFQGNVNLGDKRYRCDIGHDVLMKTLLHDLEY